MQALRNTARKIITTLARLFLKKRIFVGNESYIRRLLLPNLMSNAVRHEEFLDDVYMAALKEKEGAIIDVGVNTGQTLLKMLSLDKNRPYFGFEPQSAAASCVESFLIENGIRNYTVLPIALSDRNTCLPLHVRGNGIYSMASSVASMVKGFRPESFYNYEKYIYTAFGDDVVDSLGISSIALIKVDVEGAELEVIRGLGKTLENYRPFILFEVLHHYLVVTKERLDKETTVFRESRIQELEEQIRSKGFHIYQIIADKELKRTTRIEPEIVNDLKSTDYIAVPEENDIDFRSNLESTRRITNA